MVDLSASLRPGARFAGYRLAGMLGKGGMGTVFLAEQLSIGRQVALKVMHPHRMNTPGAIDKFLHEARLAASLTHANLVTIHEAGVERSSSLAFYSMDYVHGRTLRTIIQQEGALDDETAIELLRQMAGGLAKAHDNGMVHRDLKPANVLIDVTGRLLITDLGLAMDRISTGASNNQRVLSIVGTPGYSAPEQMRDPQTATAASDVFSLGCCLHFMLTGRDPFDGSTVIDLIAHSLISPPLGLVDLPRTTARLCERLMAKDPAERPANGHEVLALLGHRAGEGSSSSRASGARRPPRGRRRRR